MPDSISDTFSSQKLNFSYLLFGLILISLFLNLGVHPLYLEEPRRALIALEMTFNNNFIVPTEFGEYYYKKPPLYNWFIIFAYKIFGNYSEFATRFFSVLSFIGMGVTLYWIGKKYVNKVFGIYACLLFLVSIDIYYYFSVLAEIDLFYSLITLLSFFTIFHFYQKKQYLLLFVLTYFLAALGTLTKGFPSIVFLAISLPVFFIYNKDFKRLFSIHHFIGIGIFILIVGGYFYVYSLQNELTGYFDGLWSQSSERTLLEKSILSLLNHLIAFPLEVLKNILPASLFLVFINKRWFQQIKGNKLIEFCFYMFASNSLIYWLSPGSRARYVYMLYPLLILILLYFYLNSTDEKRKNIFNFLVLIFIGFCFFACIALPFLPYFDGVDNTILIGVASALIIAAIFILSIKNRSFNLLYLILTLVVIRFVFDLTVLPSRALMSDNAQVEKVDAIKVAQIAGDAKVNVYPGVPLSHTFVFYLERETQKAIKYESRKNFNDFYLALENQVADEKYKVFGEFNSSKEKSLLIKFIE